MTDYKNFLKQYDGPDITIMEVCGTHTAQIARNGIYEMLSPKIHLISGPGCPVCVTVTAYVDRLIEYSMLPDHVVVTFGDMLRVVGKDMSLNDAKALGAKTEMVYSPLDILKRAEQNPHITYVFAAVGFETTTPVYALMLERIIEKGIINVKLLTALKTMPAALEHICSSSNNIDGFLAPGHVSVLTGSDLFLPLSEKYHLPFVVSGFRAEEILASLYAIIKLRNQVRVLNLYPSVVTKQGNMAAQELVNRYFTTAGAAWRGIGIIENSGMVLKPEFAQYDAGSALLTPDHPHNEHCRCAGVLIGKISPTECPLFGKECTPRSPQGACMVSTEGSCYHNYNSRRRNP